MQADRIPQSKVHNGVLIPREMRNASVVELDAYAIQVKAGNRAFVDAYFALQDRALELGVDLERICDQQGNAIRSI